MVTEIRIYFEGDDALRPGFRSFLGQIAEAARSRRCRFSLIAASGTPVQDYRDGIKANPGAWNVLLRDSEEAIPKPRPDMPDSVFWMVEIMESWFLADPDALEPTRRIFSRRSSRNWLRRQ